MHIMANEGKTHISSALESKPDATNCDEVIELGLEVFLNIYNFDFHLHFSARLCEQLTTSTVMGASLAQ